MWDVSPCSVVTDLVKYGKCIMKRKDTRGERAEGDDADGDEGGESQQMLGVIHKVMHVFSGRNKQIWA